MSDTFAPMIVIPVYEHERAIGPLLQRLLPHGVPVLLVDDGSGERCAAVLRELAAATPSRVTLLRLDANQGKGGAVIAGLQEAGRRGATPTGSTTPPTYRPSSSTRARRPPR